MDIKGLSSLVPELHLQQIGLFLFKKGIELYFIDDDIVSKYLDSQWDYNKTPLYLSNIWRLGALSGEVLIYLKPVGDNYRMFYYPASQFEPFYDENLDLKAVVITSKKRLDKDKVITEIVRISAQKIEVWLDRNVEFIPDKTFPNPYGFLPCIIIQNYPTLSGRSQGEFDRFEHLIEQHSWMIDQLNGNMEFFGGPLFYSSRSKAEMVEAGLVEDRYSISAEGGYRPATPNMGQKIRARRIFAGLEEGEQIGFVTPSPIDSATISAVADVGKNLQLALGSVPDLELISNSNSLFEFQSRYAQAYVTALQKSRSYIDAGIVAAYNLLMRMAGVDGKVNWNSQLDKIRWRYLGDVFPDTVNNILTKSIVSRNLLRLGVNLESSLKYIFPDMTEEEILDLLRGGFAYELVDGVATIADKTKDVEGLDISAYLQSLISAETTNNSMREQ